LVPAVGFDKNPRTEHNRTAKTHYLAVRVSTINLIPFIIYRFSAPTYVHQYTIASVAFYALVAKGKCNIKGMGHPVSYYWANRRIACRELARARSYQRFI
jgi:hypothetical protein